MPEQEGKVPRKTEADLMFDNDHTCCICRERGKDVQIHHIDGNKSNNDPDNLAVLCLDCHSRVSGGRGLGRTYSIREVKKYKRDWEYTVRKRRRLILRPHRERKDAEEASCRLEIRRALYELVATRNSERAREILELMDVYLIYEGQSHFILKTLHSLIPMISSSKNALVAEHILHHFWHLPGPDHNKIRQKDRQALSSAIDVLDWMGRFNADAMSHGPSIAAAQRSLYSIFETASLYHLRDMQKRIAESMNSIKKAVSESGVSDNEKASLIVKADFYLKQIDKEMS